MSMRPIDYSKWDHIDDEESDREAQEDDDDEDNDFNPHDNEEEHIPQTLHSGDEKVKPTVTRLDQATPVTIGPNGLEIKHVARATASPFLASPPQVTSGASATAPVAGNQTQRQSSAATADDDDTDSLEDDIMMGKLSRNGAVVESRNYLWSQTRDDVTVSVILPSMGIKGSQILSFALEPTHSNNVQEEGACRLSFVVKVNGDAYQPFVLPLRYPVKCGEDAIVGCWQLLSLPTLGRRLLVAQFAKEKIGEGMYLWWDRLCVGDTPLDVRSFPDRQSQQGNHEALQKVWTDAHEEFRKRTHGRSAATDSH